MEQILSVEGVDAYPVGINDLSIGRIFAVKKKDVGTRDD